MKTILRCLTTTVLLMACSMLSAIAQSKITVYSNNFNGQEAELGEGKYDFMTLVRAGVSVVRSVRVPAGLQVTLYEKDNFTGTSLLLLQDADSKLIEGKGFGKIEQNVSIIVVKAPESILNEPTITLYRDNFSGPSLSLRAGYYDHYELGNVENDQLSSLKVPTGMKVTLYEHGGYKGKSLVITKDATADFLVKNKFNDITSSLYIEKIEEEPAPPVVEPVVVPKPEEKPTPVPQGPVVEPSTLSVLIFQGNFSGTSKRFEPGRYRTSELGIGDDELSSVQIPQDLRVRLFDKDNFAGKSVVLTEGATTEKLTELGFNNITSSLIVEVVPKVSLFEGNFEGFAFRFKPGKYDILELEQLGLMDNEVSSVKVPPGMSVILFDEYGFKGRALYLTHDANTDSLIAKKFNNITSSIQVNEDEQPTEPELKVTVYADNFTGKSKMLAAGNYDHGDLGIGSNTLSSITIPRGLRVTLYEHGAFEGRTLTLTKSTGDEKLSKYNFNDITSSMKVDQIPAEELIVTIYSESFSGRGQHLSPGRYYTRDITIGDKQLSSVKVPKGMRATLYADWNCEGVSVMLDRDEDFTGSKLFDNYYRSVVVEDVREPVLTGTTVVVTKPVTEPEPVVVEETKQTEQQETQLPPTVVYNYDPPCTLSDDAYADAVKAIDSKPFSAERMEMAKLVTRNKCLTNDQIRGIAKMFSFEEQSLEFVKYAYEQATEKDTYYKLEDIFRFMSTRDAFLKFLKQK